MLVDADGCAFSGLKISGSSVVIPSCLDLSQGSYTLSVKDAANNQCIKNFIISAEAPTISPCLPCYTNLSSVITEVIALATVNQILIPLSSAVIQRSTGENIPLDINAKHHCCHPTPTVGMLQGCNVSTCSSIYSVTIPQNLLNDVYKLIIKDSAENEYQYSFVVSKINPIIKFPCHTKAPDGKIYLKKSDLLSPIAGHILTADINGKNIVPIQSFLLTRNDEHLYSFNENLMNYLLDVNTNQTAFSVILSSLPMPTTSNGAYQLQVIDKAGNMTIQDIIVSCEAPSIC